MSQLDRPNEKSQTHTEQHEEEELELEIERQASPSPMYRKVQHIVFGFVRDVHQNLVSLSCACIESYDESTCTFDHDDDIQFKEEEEDSSKSRSISRGSSSYTLSTDTRTEKISNIIFAYYYDSLLINTVLLYPSVEDLDISQAELHSLQRFYHKLVSLGYHKRRLPAYEMLRYYFGVSRDMTRAVSKWKGSVETYTYYKLSQITKTQIKDCLTILSKSCHFCGYHVDVTHGGKSPVFVLNYEKFNWNDFSDISHVIKASFYICCWMTDKIDAIHNGLTLMINSRGIRFHHIKKAMTVLRAVQKSLALRTNHVFFLNLPSLAKSSMKLFLKIYPKNIQDRIHICSSTDSLFNLLDPQQIPQIFGGSLNANNNLPDLGTILSNYVDIKSFKHFQSNDEDYYEHRQNLTNPHDDY